MNFQGSRAKTIKDRAKLIAYSDFTFKNTLKNSISEISVRALSFISGIFASKIDSRMYQDQKGLEQNELHI